MGLPHQQVGIWDLDRVDWPLHLRGFCRGAGFSMPEDIAERRDGRYVVIITGFRLFRLTDSDELEERLRNMLSPGRFKPGSAPIDLYVVGLDDTVKLAEKITEEWRAACDIPLYLELQAQIFSA